MIDSGSLARVGGAWIAGRDVVVPLLAAARQGAMARLSALAPPSRALLRASAVLGDSFDRDVLAAILGITTPAAPPAAADGVPEEMSDASIISVSTQLPVAEGAGDDEPDRLSEQEPALAACYGAAAQGVGLFGERAGQPTLRLVRPEIERDGEPVAEVFGFNVHAALALDGRDRKRVERVCLR
jgi:hypothetical protein